MIRYYFKSAAPLSNVVYVNFLSGLLQLSTGVTFLLDILQLGNIVWIGAYIFSWLELKLAQNQSQGRNKLANKLYIWAELG